MDMIGVSSSNIESIGYDEDSQSLRVKFRNGTFGIYLNFTDEKWVSIRAIAEDPNQSIGSYIHTNVKPNHEFVKLSRHETTDNREGFLVESSKITTTNPIKAGTPEAHCPGCGLLAKGFVPPMDDPRYVDRMKMEKEIHSLETDDQAHLVLLKSNGGYIESCKCGVSFFVPASKARMLDE